MELTIKSFGSGLPCELEIFKINGIEADIEDFGETERSGNCMDYTCSQTFRFKLPTSNKVLEKYGITLEEYSAICDKLGDTLCVRNCGMCS